jgi:hypothetical protein
VSNLRAAIRISDENLPDISLSTGDGGNCIPATFPFLSSSCEHGNCDLRWDLDSDIRSVLIVHLAAFGGDKLVF